MEGDEANVSDNQVETWDDTATAWTVPEADAWGDDPLERSNERAGVAIKRIVEFEALGDGPTTKTQVEGGAGANSQIEVHAEEVDMIVEEVEEFEVPNEEMAEVTDAAWGFENTTPKVVDEDPEVTQVPVTVLMPNQGDTFDFEGMPDLEDVSSKEITGEEPSMNVPLTEGPPALPWVCFKAQVHQNEIQYWDVMFTWFQYMHLSWEESWKKRDDA